MSSPPPSNVSTAGLARLSALHPWRVLLAWLVVLVLAVVAAQGLGDVTTTEVNLLSEPESVKASNLIDERFNEPERVSETVIVRSSQLTVDDPAFQQIVQQLTSDLQAMSGVVASAVNYYQAQAVQSPEAPGMVSADRHTTLIPVTFEGTFDEANAHTDEFLALVKDHGTSQVEALAVGDLSVSQTFTKTAEADLQTAELVGLPVALLILVVVFGALVAAGIPLVLALISIVVALGLTAIVGRVMDLSFFVVNMITMIGLAVGIDYALFIVERYREERRRGLAKLDAITTAGGTASKAVLFSGITVVLALLGLFIVPTTIFRSLGTGAILVVIVAVAAMLTLVPALLSLLGDRIDWPRTRRSRRAVAGGARADQPAHASGFWGRVTGVVMRHSVASLTLTAVLLVALTIPYFDLRRGQAGAETLPPSEVKTAFGILNQEFTVGLLAPVKIVVDAPRGEPVEAGIARLVATLERDPRFVAPAEVGWDQRDDLARISIPLRSDANSPEAYTTVRELRQQLIPAAFDGVPARVLVTGSTALNADFIAVVDRYTPIVFAFVLGLSFLLLLLAFRSLVVPAKAILMNLLSVGASYGLLVLIFQKGVGHELFGFQQTPSIEVWIPILMFCILFGLSMDYHIFLLSRIREHYDQTHRNQESVAVGLTSTGRIITGAALIMVVVFGGFAAGQMVMFQQIGFGLAAAILLDATVVRSILVPSAMALLGDRNWYLPRWLHWLPDLRVEGETHARPVEPTAAD